VKLKLNGSATASFNFPICKVLDCSIGCNAGYLCCFWAKHVIEFGFWFGGARQLCRFEPVFEQFLR